jgi:hypothetical protein
MMRAAMLAALIVGIAMQPAPANDLRAATTNARSR